MALRKVIAERQILQAEGQRKRRVIMARKDGRRIMTRDETVAHAAFDCVPQHVQRHSRLLAEHQALSNDGRMGEPEIVSHQLDHIAGAQLAAADDATHRFEHRLHPVKRVVSTAGEDGELPMNRPVDRARDRCIYDRN